MASQSLDELTRQLTAANGKIPDVSAWNPDSCGDIDICITREGQWHYMSSPIGREALVKLFSSVLRLDADGDYYLVTPHEKLRIQVDVAPFVAVDYQRTQADGLDVYLFETKEGLQVAAGPAHPIRLIDVKDQALPLVNVRSNLDALIHRNLLYHLIDEAQERVLADGLLQVGIESSGVFFPLAEPFKAD